MQLKGLKHALVDFDESTVDFQKVPAVPDLTSDGASAAKVDAGRNEDHPVDQPHDADHLANMQPELGPVAHRLSSRLEEAPRRKEDGTDDNDKNYTRALSVPFSLTQPKIRI